jgi:hypothetical protein
MKQFLLFLFMVSFSFSSINLRTDSGHPYYELFYDRENLAFHSLSSLPKNHMEHFTSRLPQNRSEQKVYGAYALYLDGKSHVTSVTDEDELSLSTSAHFLTNTIERSLFSKLKSGKEPISYSFLHELFEDPLSPWSPPLTKKRIKYWNLLKIGKVFAAGEAPALDTIIKTLISESVIDILKKISSDTVSFEKVYSIFQRHFFLPEDPKIQSDELITIRDAELTVTHFYQFFTPYNIARKILTTISKEDLHGWLLKSNICSKIYLGRDGEITLRGAILMLYQMDYINPDNNMS